MGHQTGQTKLRCRKLRRLLHRRSSTGLDLFPLSAVVGLDFTSVFLPITWRPTRVLLVDSLKVLAGAFRFSEVASTTASAITAYGCCGLLWLLMLIIEVDKTAARQ